MVFAVLPAPKIAISVPLLACKFIPAELLALKFVAPRFVDVEFANVLPPDQLFVSDNRVVEADDVINPASLLNQDSLTDDEAIG